MIETTPRGRIVRQTAIAFIAAAALAASLIGCDKSNTASTTAATVAAESSPSAVSASSATTSPVPPAAASSPPTAVPGNAVATKVAVGKYLVNVVCTGTASTTPTIVLVAGMPDPLTKFTALQATLSRTTRVCSYDRLGEGASAKPSGSQTLSDSAQVLDEVLTEENVTGKVIVVGHSLGGLIAAQFAHQYPARVAAVVLFDASAPSVGGAIDSLIPASPTGIFAEVRGEVDSLSSATTNPEGLVYTGQPIGSLGSIPLTVVQHGQQIYSVVPKYGAQLQAIWTKGQQQLAQLSRNSKLITAAKSGHYIYLDQQPLAVQLIEHATAN